MTILYAGVVAALGVFTGCAHSAIGERKLFGPLSREEQRGVLAARSTREVTRAVWHLPSIGWAIFGFGVLYARLHGGDPLVSVMAASFFAISGIANMTALRQPHFGGLLLLLTAALTLADWRFG